MKLTWKKQNKKRTLPTISHFPNLPFEDQAQVDHHNHHQNPPNFGFDTGPTEHRARNDDFPRKTLASSSDVDDYETAQLSQAFQAQGDKLAEDGKYSEALGKWESAITLMPNRSVLHEQKAQVLLEIGEAWNAVKAATRATELEPSWAEAWITLGRAQLNYGEPDNAIESFDQALTIKPDSVEARDDRQTASHLVKRRKQLHSSG